MSSSSSDDIKLEIEKRKEEIRRKKEALEAYKNKKTTNPHKASSLIEALITPRISSPQQQQQFVDKTTTQQGLDESKKQTTVIPLVDTKKAAAIQRGELFEITNNGTIISEIGDGGGESVKRVRELKLVSRVNVIDLPPISKMVYEKSTQTDRVEFEDGESIIDSKIIKEEELNEKQGINVDELIVTDDSDFVIPAEYLTSIEVVREEKLEQEDFEKRYREVSSTREFQDFFFKASRFVEKCIRQPFDPLLDYADFTNSFQVSKSEKVHLETTFYDQNICQQKAVTSLSWSPKFEELFLATYCSSDILHEHEGLVLVWNQHYARKPEVHLHCETPISTAQFYSYNPSLVIGGTYTGQIVVWDIREKSTAPVIRTAISSRSHTEPIFGMEIVGSSEAGHNLVTMSTDGRICTWSMNKLDTPPEVVDLTIVTKYEQHDGLTQSSNPVELIQNLERNSVYAPTSILSQVMKFPKGEINRFYVGSENGIIYSADRFGSKKGLNNDKYHGHLAPITSLDSHPTMEFSDLLISSSMDWTCKLWCQRKHTPLLSFDEFEDYVYDVKWSPQNPSLFAAVDGAGILSLWNINLDQEMPIYKTHVCSSALNKLEWSRDGKRLVTGSLTGSVYMYNIDEEIGIPKQKELETKLLESVIVDLVAADDTNYSL